jgi:hypothetical protein
VLVVARFEDVVVSFWGDEGYGVQAPLTRSMVADAEREIGVVLPPELLELLQLRNGGPVAVSWSTFPTNEATSWSTDHVPFDSLLGIGRDERGVTLLDSPYLVKEWGLPSPVVLLSGEGPCWIGLDYRMCGPSGNPSVTWFDADFKAELPLAEDFRAFVEGLMPSPVGGD